MLASIHAPPVRDAPRRHFNLVLQARPKGHRDVPRPRALSILAALALKSGPLDRHLSEERSLDALSWQLKATLSSITS